MKEPIKTIPIGGFLKQSLIDYPGHISAVLFTCGCNFRCNYCHNAQLVYPALINKSKKLNEKRLLEWIKYNNKMLDAVVITGGEPTLHTSLPTLIKKIKNQGLKIKLDTNGTNPNMLKNLIEEKLVDYVAMDIKAPLSLKKYKMVVGDGFTDELLTKTLLSVKILTKNKVDYEFRTTLDENLTLDDLKFIAKKISGKYFLQKRHKHAITSHQNIDLEIFNDYPLEVHVR